MRYWKFSQKTKLKQKIFTDREKEVYCLFVDPDVTNRPIRFKLAARTDDPEILRTTLQIPGHPQ